MRSDHFLVILIVALVSACAPVTPAAPATLTGVAVPSLVNPTPTLANTPVLIGFPTAPAASATPPPPTVTLSPATPASARPGTGGPVVQVVSPLTNTQISVNQTVYVVAFAATDSTLARVELADDGVPVHTENAPAASTFAAVMPWTPSQSGAHVLRVFAVDTNNVAGPPEEVNISVTPDTRKPTANILFPLGTPQVELGSILQVYAAASDETGITQIELWVDKQLYTYVVPPPAAGNSTAPSTAPADSAVVFAWPALGTGNHSLTIRAHDTQDQTTDSPPLNVVVVDTHAPAVSVSFDRTNVPVGEPISIGITALDVSGIQRIELWTGKEISSTFGSANAARQTSMSVQYTWQSGTTGDFPVYARAFNMNGDAKDSAAQIISVLRPSQPTPTRPPQPTPTRTRTPRPQPTARLQPPLPPSVEISQPADKFSNLFPLRIVYNAKGNAELDHVEVWGYMQGQPNPQVICSVETHATTQKTGQCDWSPPTVGLVSVYAQVFDIFHQSSRSPIISGLVGVPALPTPTPSPVPLTGRWVATAGNPAVVVFRPIVTASGTALRGDYRTASTAAGATANPALSATPPPTTALQQTAPPLTSAVPTAGSTTGPTTTPATSATPSPSAELVGRITSGSVKGDRVTFRVEFTAASTVATATPGPDGVTATPAPTATPFAPALDFDCGVDSTGNVLDCKIKDARGASSSATFKRETGP